jgi:hypothetical protein
MDDAFDLRLSVESARLEKHGDLETNTVLYSAVVVSVVVSVVVFLPFLSSVVCTVHNCLRRVFTYPPLYHTLPYHTTLSTVSVHETQNTFTNHRERP